MKIGIDLLPLQSGPRRRGISNLTYNLVMNILKMGNSNSYVLYNTKNLTIPEFTSPNVTNCTGPIVPESSKDLDVFHATNIVDLDREIAAPSMLKCRTVVTIYDLIPIVLWENYIDFFPQDAKHKYFERLSMTCEFDRVITISEQSKKDIVELLEIPPDKIDVIYLGVHERFSPLDENDKKRFEGMKLKYNISNNYILSVPSMDYRKNTDRLIEAYGLLPDEIKGKYQLIITNEVTEQYKSYLEDIISKNGIPDDRIILTDYLLPEQLVQFYKNASLFVFPSLYESFGLPVLEAMACGIPVVSSNTSSIPEIARDSAILVDPYSITEISEAMKLVLLDDQLKSKLSKDGIARSKEFTWQKTAVKTLESYKKVVQIKKEVPKELNTKKPRLGVVSTWNTRCGIAEYAKNLIKELDESNFEIFIFADFQYRSNLIKKDEINVSRCWKLYFDDLHQLYEEMKCRNLDVVHFQFNFGFFNMNNLIDLAKKLSDDNIKLIITFHSTSEVVIHNSRVNLANYSNELNVFDKIIVHTLDDVSRLRKAGIFEKVELLPIGCKWFYDQNKYLLRKRLNMDNSIVVSTFGFMLPHKGITELLKSIGILKKQYSDILLLVVSALYPVDISRIYLEECQEWVEKLGLTDNVLFFTEFLDENEIINLLQLSDVIVLPYHESSESTSAAARFALSSRRPVIVTDIPIFGDLENEVYKICGYAPQIIADAISNILGNKVLQDEIVAKAAERIEAHSWKNFAKRYAAMIEEMLCFKEGAR